MKILIKVTKDVLRRSYKCGIQPDGRCDIDSQGCAIAVAIQEFFPKAMVTPWFFTYYNGIQGYQIELPDEATQLIYSFDSLRGTPEKRLDLPEVSFEITVPPQVIESIGIGQVYKILSESRTLELVHP